MNQLHILLFLAVSLPLFGQQKLEIDGQISFFGSVAPDNDLKLFLGGRYIPELSYGIALDSIKMLDFEASGNFSTSFSSLPFNETDINGTIRPYRIWTRYTTKQFEVRVGLQKIDFGSATLLRPIQWFNQLDPRDPLQLTNGVYGALGRYYFLNNANVWLWALYGNEKTRGFDVLKTNKKLPEFGGRFQHPIPRGELAFSYHYRIASSKNLSFVPQFEKIPEHRLGLDGKWDLVLGLWFETTVIHKIQKLGILTNQALFNIGSDYTFGVGSGLSVSLEHLAIASSEKFLTLDNIGHITASTIAYSLGFFDVLSSVFLYNWTSEDFTLSLNYEHQFEKITGYLIVYYNPSTLTGIQQNDLVNQFSGPGMRVILVYDF